MFYSEREVTEGKANLERALGYRWNPDGIQEGGRWKRKPPLSYCAIMPIREATALIDILKQNPKMADNPQLCYMLFPRGVVSPSIQVEMAEFKIGYDLAREHFGQYNATDMSVAIARRINYNEATSLVQNMRNHRPGSHAPFVSDEAGLNMLNHSTPFDWKVSSQGADRFYTARVAPDHVKIVQEVLSAAGGMRDVAIDCYIMKEGDEITGIFKIPVDAVKLPKFWKDFPSGWENRIRNHGQNDAASGGLTKIPGMPDERDVQRLEFEILLGLKPDPVTGQILTDKRPDPLSKILDKGTSDFRGGVNRGDGGPSGDRTP